MGRGGGGGQFDAWTLGWKRSGVQGSVHTQGLTFFKALEQPEVFDSGFH